VAQFAGELRDADVLIDHIYAPVAGKMKGEPGFGELRAALLAHRSKKREEVRAALSGEQWSKVRLFLALWPRTMQDDKGLQAPVSEFASVALGKAWKKIKKQGDEIETLSLEQRHEMRKALKSFRYLVEFFGSLYEPKSVASFVKDLKKLQDVFGYVNDVASAGQINTICHTRCADNREAQRAAGYVLGWHQAQSGHCWKAASKGWSRLAKRDRFWS
jgi:CHAD domain-containing protein